jgi:hypothetical protein
MEKAILNFNDCTITDFDKRFGLRWSRPLLQLDEGMEKATTMELSEYEIATSLQLKNRYFTSIKPKILPMLFKSFMHRIPPLCSDQLLV